MASNVRFADQLSVSAFGNIGGANAVSSSYAETASFADYATSASYAVSASHEITKEVSSSHADTASFAQSGNGIFSGSFSGSFEGNGSGLTNIPASGITGLNLSQIASGSATASISPNGGLQINSGVGITGSLILHNFGGNTAAGSSIVLGFESFASNDSLAVGANVSASNINTVAFGDQTRAQAQYSFTQGYKTLAEVNPLLPNSLQAKYANAEGWETSASAVAAHAEGYQTQAGSVNVNMPPSFFGPDKGRYSHAEGYQTKTFGQAAHAEGYQSQAGYLKEIAPGFFQTRGDYSHAEGQGTIASGSYQHAQGNYNTYGNDTSLVIIGNGTNDLNRSDLALFNTDGIVFNQPLTASSNISSSGFISASYFIGDGSQLTNIVSSSYALTASYVETAQTASYIISSSIDGITDYIRNDQTSSMTVLSSSFALTSSYVETAQTASYVLEAISSSYSSFAVSASYAVSASHEIIKEVSSSYADTASFAQSGNGVFSGSFSGSFTGVSPTASYALTASYVETAQTASYIETAQTASYVLNAVSSSYSFFAVSASYAVSASHEITKEVSSSYADTASFAQSGNGLFSGSFSGSFEGDGSNLTGVDPFPFSGSAVITGSLLVSGSSKPLEIIGSGSTVFSVQGSLGELFAIDDQLSGSLLVVNDISGLPQFEVFSDGRTLIGADPRSLYTTATINATLAATSQSIYSLSTSSYDGVFFDYTVTSASNARAGNIMSIWNGGNLVYTENTTTDIGSTVGVTFNVEISQSQAQLISVTDTAGWKIKTTIRSI